MELATVLPDWLDGMLIPDETFASAYSSVSAQQRALFKTAIARAHAIVGPRRDHERLTSRSLRQGVDVAVSTRPASCAVVLFDSASSPGFVLAALVPAFLAGVAEVLAVHVGDDFPSQDMLTALELVGQERVAAMNADTCFELLAETDAADGLRVCVVGVEAASSVPIPEVPGLSLWRAAIPENLGVWQEEPVAPGGAFSDTALKVAESHAVGSVNADVVAYCHPCLGVDCCGPVADGPDARFEDFLDGHEVVFVPEELLVQCLPSCRLVLGPGEESVWLWPDLSVEFFLVSRLAISRSV